jgi:hypothetical protein
LKDSADLLAAEFVGDVREGLTDFINPAAGIGVTPMPDLLYFPWSFSVYDDKKKAGYNRSRGIQLNPSLITLTPAPGEYLDLNFTVRGQFMEPTDSTAYIQVVADNEDSQFGVLLEYNGIEYPPSSRIPFSPTHPLFGLRLHGLEGATGRLVVSTTSQILVEELTVSIPFVLAGCPFGFYSPIATDWVIQLCLCTLPSMYQSVQPSIHQSMGFFIFCLSACSRCSMIKNSLMRCNKMDSRERRQNSVACFGILQSCQ